MRRGIGTGARCAPPISSRSVLPRPPAQKALAAPARLLSEAHLRLGGSRNQHFCCSAAMSRAATGTNRGTFAAISLCGRFRSGRRGQLMRHSGDQPDPGARHPAGGAGPAIIAPLPAPGRKRRNARPPAALVIDDAEPALIVGARADEEVGAGARAGRSRRPARTARRAPAPGRRRRGRGRRRARCRRRSSGPSSPIRTGLIASLSKHGRCLGAHVRRRGRAAWPRCRSAARSPQPAERQGPITRSAARAFTGEDLASSVAALIAVTGSVREWPIG